MKARRNLPSKVEHRPLQILPLIADVRQESTAQRSLHGPRGWNIGTLCIIDQKPARSPLLNNTYSGYSRPSPRST